MRIRQTWIAIFFMALAARPLIAQSPVLSDIEAPYPPLQNSVPIHIAGQSYTAGAVAYGTRGTPLIVNGTNFGTSGTVLFPGSVPAVVSMWTPTAIYLTVPASATTGLVQVSTGGNTSNGVPFIVTNGTYAGSCPAHPPANQLQITTPYLPNGTVAKAYSATVGAAGGTPPYIWSLAKGSLPPALSLSSSTGNITGTPTTAISVPSITIQANDSWGHVTQAVFGISVNASASPTGDIISTVAGNGTAGYSSDGVQATSSELNAPSGVSIDSAGNIYIADHANYRIRKVSASTGIISTVAGNGTSGGYVTGGLEHNLGYAGNGGAATNVALGYLQGVAVDSAGNIYFSDADYAVVRKVTASTGIISTIAGYGTLGYSGDGGPATSAYLYNPTGVALDAAGNIYIADETDNVIRKITAATGIISTVAGNGLAGYSGDGGQATSATLNGATGVALDAAGNIYIADESNEVIRKVTVATGIISTIAGTGYSGYSGDGGQATSAQLSDPSSVTVDFVGDIYIADSSNVVVRKVTSATGIINTVAGNHTSGYSGDGGLATNAELGFPYGVGVAVSNSRSIYIADFSGERVRAVTPSIATPTITWIAPTAITFGTGLSSSQLTATANVPGTFEYSPSLGTVLTVGVHTLSVSFTPTDTADYTTATATVTLTVNQATPAITWSTLSTIGEGTPLSTAQLDASSSVPGVFTYAPGLGAVLSVGAHTLNVTFTPSDNMDYTSATAQAYLTVSQAGGTWDSGIIALIVNNSTVSTTGYRKGSTPSTIAAGLASAVAPGSPVNVTAVGDALYIEAKTSGSASNYTYSLQDWSYDSVDFGQPSFAYPTLSGSLDGGANQGADGGTTVYSYQGGYDGVGNLIQYTDSSNGSPIMGSWLFSYDTLNRLDGATDNEPGNQSTNYCWSYDYFGNRTVQAGSNTTFQAGSTSQTPCTPAANASFTNTWTKFSPNNNRIATTSQAPGGVTYDLAGNITNDGLNQYLYDADGRICAVSSTPVPGVTTMTGYIYDADGNRVAKGGITAWSCDPTVSGFTTTSDYVLGLSGEQVTEMDMDANNSLAWQHTNVYAAGQLVGTYDNDGLHFYLNDPLGTRRAQTDSAGVLEQTCSSLPFGDSLACSGSSQFPTENHFTGKERDSESGLDYFGARYYGSNMGRFMSPDAPVDQHPENPQSWNLYSYVRNNPLSNVDLDGNYDCGQMSAAQCFQFGYNLSAAQNQLTNAHLNGDITDAQFNQGSSAISAYGNMNDHNGVTVNVGATGGFPGTTYASNDGTVSAANPTGQNIQVTFNPGVFNGGNSDAINGVIGHEGSHVGDAEAWAKAGFTDAARPTNFDTEFKAYGVTSIFGAAQGAGILRGTKPGDTTPHLFWERNFPDVVNNALRTNMIKTLYPNWGGEGVRKEYKPGEKVMRKLACILLLAVSIMYAQSPDTSFVLDGTKPYVYLQFDHVGPRKPLHEGEPSTGLWLRIVNNCKVPISVRSYGVTTGDIGTGVFDEIIPVQPVFTVQADSGEIPLSTDEKPPQKTANERSAKMPEGYSAELGSVTRILPGKSLLFSVARNHVSPDWFLRVKFALAVSKPSVGPGPFTELDFFNEQIPASSR